MRSNNYKWIALSCTSLGAFFSVLNSSALIIALPEIMHGLQTNVIIMIWVLMIYMLIITILVPAIGRVADIIGRKELYVLGFIIFTIGSLFCGFSINGTMLLISRVVQSIGGALLVANSTSIVTDAFPKEELGKALGINAMVISIGFVIGPVMGGLLTELLGWQYVFLLNVPVGIFGTIWAWVQLREIVKLPEHQHFDWIGTLTFSYGLFALLLVLTIGAFFGWTLFVFGLFASSIISLIVFLVIENRINQPMLDLTLFRSRLLGFAFTSNLLNGIARGSVLFLMVFYLQGLKGMDPLLAGIYLTPFAMAMMVLAPLSGYFSDKVGQRVLSSLGLLISAIGLFGFVTVQADSHLSLPIIYSIIMGVGSGMFFSPNTSSIMGNVPPVKRGIAAGTRTMMNNAGSVISIAIGMAVISTSITPEALTGLITGVQTGTEGIEVAQFIAGLHKAFLISFIISIIASFLSYLRGKPPKWQKNVEKSEISETQNNKSQDNNKIKKKG